MPDDNKQPSPAAAILHNPRRLEGMVAIVTGGSRGIGEAIVRAFVHHGVVVVVADIDDAGGQALAAVLGPHV
uniref:SDR family NAD(P)-dependent oxidoreductase n=1 Tax=Oryza punctata TaxID=4537 RepID=A0A0E0LDI0_ORYPU